MINKETWKIRTEHDKMETLIKYHMHIQFHKKHLFLKKKKNSQVTIKTFHCFFLWMIYLKHTI